MHPLLVARVTCGRDRRLEILPRCIPLGQLHLVEYRVARDNSWGAIEQRLDPDRVDAGAVPLKDFVHFGDLAERFVYPIIQAFEIVVRH